MASRNWRVVWGVGSSNSKWIIIANTLLWWKYDSRGHHECWRLIDCWLFYCASLLALTVLWFTIGWLQGSRAPGNFVVEQRKSTDQAASEQAMGTFRLHTKQYWSWEIRVRVDIILESFIHISTSNLRTYKEHHIQVRWEWGCYFSLEIWGSPCFSPV